MFAMHVSARGLLALSSIALTVWASGPATAQSDAANRASANAALNRPDDAAREFQHDDTARAAKAYADWIRRAWKAAGKPAEPHYRAGLAALDRGDNPDAAARHFARALAEDPEMTAAWLGIARALLAKPVASLDGARRYTTPRNAAGAAWQAYTLSTEPRAQAEALAVLATALERRSLFRPALDALSAGLKLNDAAELRTRYEALRLKHGFRIVDYVVESESKAPRVCVQFSEGLKPDTDLYTRFVAVDGRPPDAVTLQSQRLCVDGLSHGETYRLRLRAGLPSAIGETLLKTADLGIFVKDRTPAVRFSGNSYILPKTAQNGIPLVSVNADAADISIYRVGDRALVRQIFDGVIGRNLGAWQQNQIEQRWGERVYRGQIALRVERNEDVTTAVPVRDAVPDMTAGVYAMVAKPAGQPEHRSSGATQWFVVTDIGLTALSGDTGVHVLMRSLETADAMQNVRVRLIARNNEVLATAISDARGHVHFDGALARGEGGLAPALVVAESDAAGYAFLDLTRSAFDLTDRGVAGRSPPGPVDGFLFTDRGIYRPGSTIHATALVRTSTGSASALPTTLIVSRPDGVVFSSQTLKDQGHGGRTQPIAIPAGGMTGTWRLALHLDPKAPPIAETAVLLQDFLPERLELNVSSDATAIRPDAPARVTVTGRYLYGPPASDLVVEGDTIVTVADAEGPGQHEGFHFGDAERIVTPVRARLETIARTNAEGQAEVTVSLPAIPRTAKPLTAKVSLRLREPGGRTIERTLLRPVVAGIDRIGIKPRFENARLAEGARAAFDVITVDGQNARTSHDNLDWRIVRLDRVWQWYRRDGQWAYDAATVPTRVAAGTVATAAAETAEIGSDLPPGRYRLEIATPRDAAATMRSTFIFTVGWYQDETADSPEVLDVALDKPAYQTGDTARVRVATREGGKATLAVIGGGVHHIRTLDLEAGTSEIRVTVDETWGAGAYATVMLHRPMNIANRQMPTRAVGLAWIKLDQHAQALQVELSAPEQMRSDRTLSLPITVKGLAEGETARVTVAAVDVGILNLTRFRTPDPVGHFFGQTRLTSEIRDVYGRLIDGMRAERGTLRNGGDIDAGLAMSGAPPIGKTVALFSGIVAVDADGRGEVAFDMPEFNGTVRLMAVAWSDSRVGHSNADVIVRDPVALTVSTPRFLTVGDTAQMTVNAHNVDGADGSYRVSVSAVPENGPVTLLISEAVTLAKGQRHRLQARLAPERLGRYTLITTVEGPDDLRVKRELALDIQPVAQYVRTTTDHMLAPGESFEVAPDVFKGLLPGSATLSLTAGPTARFDVPGLLASLDRYPYGCTEQTISRALPLVYANALAIDRGVATDSELEGRINAAVTRVLGHQNGAGAFGLWSAGRSDLWLTAYALDFLGRARSEGHAVPQAAFTRGIDHLANVISYTQSVDGDGASLAYAFYVLAREGRAPAGELRYYAETKFDAFRSPLARAQMAAALAMIGDKARAKQLMSQVASAISQPVDVPTRTDFGSALRDFAAVTALAAEVGLNDVVTGLADPLADAYAARGRTSTQEQAWLVLAAKALNQSADDVSLAINGQPLAGALALKRTYAQIATAPDKSLTIRNTSNASVPLVLTTLGASNAPLPAVDQGFVLTRRYFKLDGTPVPLESATGGTASLEQNERLVVVITATAQAEGGRLLLVDHLPAGLEIENPTLVDSGNLTALGWLKTPQQPTHTEFRDDRFVASFDLNGANANTATGGRELSVAYIVRAVTPGDFSHPAAFIEDMYRPERFARTASGRLTITARN